MKNVSGLLLHHDIFRRDMSGIWQYAEPRHCKNQGRSSCIRFEFHGLNKKKKKMALYRNLVFNQPNQGRSFIMHDSCI